MKKSIFKVLIFGVGIFIVLIWTFLIVDATWNETKIENGGKTAAGQLTAKDYNDLVKEVKSIKADLAIFWRQ